MKLSELWLQMHDRYAEQIDGQHISARRFAIAAELARRSDENGVTGWVTFADLRNVTHTKSKNGVRPEVRALRKAGWLAWAVDGGRRGVRYRLCLPAYVSDVAA